MQLARPPEKVLVLADLVDQVDLLCLCLVGEEGVDHQALYLLEVGVEGADHQDPYLLEVGVEEEARQHPYHLVVVAEVEDLGSILGVAEVGVDHSGLCPPVVEVVEGGH